MLYLKNIEDIARDILMRKPDPVVRYRILRDILLKTPDDSILKASKQKMLQSGWVKELEKEQKIDGSWGRFHSQDTKIKARFKTTEGAIKRGLALGLDAEDDIFKRVIKYMNDVLEGKRNWSDWDEKNERWPLIVRLVTAGTLAMVDPKNIAIDSEWEFWFKVVQHSFASGVYSFNGETQAYRKLCKISSVPISFLITKYVLNILSARIEKLPKDLDEKIVRWIWQKDEIRYIGTSLNKPKDRHLNHWFYALETLSRFKSWKEYTEKAINWILLQRNLNGLWNFGSSVAKSEYFPLSESWRKKENREIDYSIRILVLLRRYIENNR